MIKNLFVALSAICFATSMMAQTGLSCDDPIVVGKDYEGRIDGPCTRWYTASIYDLPLRVFFVPDTADSKDAPEVYVDFTCTPGVYEDKKLDSLLNKVSIFGVALPLEFLCGEAPYQGKKAWDLYIPESYREKLSNAGITYDVTSLVKVVFPESGMITLTPDTVFSDCVKKSEYVKLGDTLDILPNDSSRSFVFPYTDWKEDSIRFVWVGDESAQVWVATDNCNFTPSVMSSYVRNTFDISNAVSYKLYADDMDAAIKEAQNGGIFFGKVLSTTVGKFVIEKIPEAPPAGGAILLEYDKPVSVKANTNQIYAFPITWTNATMFKPSTTGNFQMQISNSHRFVDSTGIFVSDFSASTYDVYAVHITSSNLKSLTGAAKDKYLYVRFITAKDIQVTPHLWAASPCLDKTKPIVANTTFSISSSSASSTYYRVKYEDFSGYDMSVNWEGNARVTMYIGDTCQFASNTSNARIVHSKAINKKTTYVIPAATVDSWASRVSPDGFLYVKFSSTSGKITFQTEKPEPVIPEEPTSPCVLGSIELKAGDQLTLNLDSAFTIYRVNYAEFAAQDRTLTWTGVEPLHTFVAETCTFAVAPYNKYVHVYMPVPAQGDAVWTTTQLADLAEFVDEDGYLYIRFLTEKEGVLTVK